MLDRHASFYRMFGGQGRREKNKCFLEINGFRIVKFSPYASEVSVDMVSRFGGRWSSEEEGGNSPQLLSSRGS